MKIIVVTGGRDWDNPTVVRDALTVHGQRGDYLIHGACRGLDLQAAKIAFDLGFIVDSMPAEWRKHYGYPDTLNPCPTYERICKYKGYCVFAGPRRNRQMLDRLPNLVLSFHPQLAKSSGTKDCVDEAIRRGIPVMHHDGHNAYWLNGPNAVDVTF